MTKRGSGILAIQRPAASNFIGQSLLGDVAGNQDKVVRRATRVIQRGGAGMLVLATEMDVRKLEDAPH
jgi:hypothetical protein